MSTLKAIFFAFCILMVIGSIANSCDSSSDSKSYRCSSCDRTFTNSADKKSIVYNNMCENCYDNYKYTQNVREGLKQYQERYGY